MSLREAINAWEHADTVTSGCQSIDELDEASDYNKAIDNCPTEFTQEQKQFVQVLILRAFEKAIGRA